MPIHTAQLGAKRSASTDKPRARYQRMHPRTRCSRSSLHFSIYLSTPGPCRTYLLLRLVFGAGHMFINATIPCDSRGILHKDWTVVPHDLTEYCCLWHIYICLWHIYIYIAVRARCKSSTLRRNRLISGNFLFVCCSID